mgnify:CR=1 FL=1
MEYYFILRDKNFRIYSSIEYEDLCLIPICVIFKYYIWILHLFIQPLQNTRRRLCSCEKSVCLFFCLFETLSHTSAAALFKGNTSWPSPPAPAFPHSQHSDHLQIQVCGPSCLRSGFIQKYEKKKCYYLVTFHWLGYKRKWDYEMKQWMKVKEYYSCSVN